MSEIQKPLAGLKVVELGTLIAGPFCTRIMAEFGAEVIKVEAPDGGDPLRKWRKLYEGTSLWWYVQARNKKSVTANLKHPEGRDFVRKLIADADILVENFRPGVADHDFHTKLNMVKRFLEQGKHVKVTIMFRRREMRRPENGYEVLERIKEELAEIIRLERDAGPLEGRDLTMVLAPGRKSA